jgi:hypothetical protein
VFVLLADGGKTTMKTITNYLSSLYYILRNAEYLAKILRERNAADTPVVQPQSQPKPIADKSTKDKLSDKLQIASALFDNLYYKHCNGTPGKVITTIHKLADELGIDCRAVRYRLDLLVKNGFVIKSGRKILTLTVYQPTKTITAKPLFDNTPTIAGHCHDDENNVGQCNYKTDNVLTKPASAGNTGTSANDKTTKPVSPPHDISNIKDKFKTISHPQNSNSISKSNQISSGVATIGDIASSFRPEMFAERDNRTAEEVANVRKFAIQKIRQAIPDSPKHLVERVSVAVADFGIGINQLDYWLHQIISGKTEKPGGYLTGCLMSYCRRNEGKITMEEIDTKRYEVFGKKQILKK